MFKSKISIVTISFNQSKFLEECINSVIRQNYENLEYIVVDGGSKDNSREIISKYKDQIKVIFQETNTGPADALNLGFKISKGELCGYINSDDFLLKNSLEKVNDYFIKYPNVDLIYGNGVIVDETSLFKRRMISRDFNLNSYRFGRGLICQQSTFFRKKVFEKVNGFNKDNFRSWDFEFFADAYNSKFKVKRVEDTFGAFRIYSDSISGDPDKTLSLKTHKRLFYKYYNREKNTYDKLIALIFYFFDRLINPLVCLNRIKDKIKSKRNIKIE